MCPQFRSCFFVHFVVEKNPSSKNKYLVPFRAFSDRKRKITELLYKDEVYKIQGAIFEVYKEVVTGFLEAVYQESWKKNYPLAISHSKHKKR